MTLTDPRPFRIGAIGMDQRQHNMLRVLFARKCANRYDLVEECSAELCILDLDASDGEHLWQEFRRRHPQQPLILVSLKDRTVVDPSTLFVKKPIPVHCLMKALQTQCGRLEEAPPADDQDPADPSTPGGSAAAGTATPEAPISPQLRRPPPANRIPSLAGTAAEQVFVGTAADVDPWDPEQRAGIYYNPDHYLQGHVQQALNLAVRHNRNVTVEGPWPTLELFIQERRIRVAAEERHLRPYCTLPDATREVSLQLFDGEIPRNGDTQTYSTQTFFWKLALWASRGRLPEGTNLFRPIYLRRWPNFTRLVVTPYALAIAALWAEQPRSLIDTAHCLQIPQRYVFAFYSAAKSLQLAGETRRAADTLLAPPDLAVSRQRGPLERLLDRLKGHAAP